MPTSLGDVVLLDQGIFAMEGDRVEVQVEGMTTGQTEPAHGVEPAAHQLRVADRVDPATVFGQERSLGDDVQSGEEGQSLVQNPAHDMAVACRPEQLQGQERSQSAAGWDHLRSGESRSLEDAIEGDRGQNGQEEEQAAELGLKRARAEVKLPDIGDIGCGRPRARWAFVVGPARQASESFVLEDLGDGDRAEGMSLVGQIAADVVDGEVLLSQGDDAVTEGVALGCGMRPLGRCEEEVASGTLAELVDEDAEAPRGVTEAASHLDAGETVDEEGAEGLVLAMGGVGGFEEDLGEVR